jgi:hypothetical protein
MLRSFAGQARPRIVHAVVQAADLDRAIRGAGAGGGIARLGRQRPLSAQVQDLRRRAAILFGSLLLTAVGFAAGTIAALHLIPWYTVVIGGGLAVLVAPLVLQLFPDRFIDGRGAAVVFAAACILLAIVLIVLAIGFWR